MRKKDILEYRLADSAKIEQWTFSFLRKSGHLVFFQVELIFWGEEQGQPWCHSGCSLIANIGDKVAFFIIDFTLNMSTLPQEDFNLSLTVDAA